MNPRTLTFFTFGIDSQSLNLIPQISLGIWCLEEF
jgi:hypothetical protein